MAKVSETLEFEGRGAGEITHLNAFCVFLRL